MWKRFLLKTDNGPHRFVDDHALVISPRDATLHTLNATAQFIWERANGQRTLESIASEMVQEFAVEASTARTEAEAFVSVAVARGLLTSHDAPVS